MVVLEAVSEEVAVREAVSVVGLEAVSVVGLEEVAA